MGFLGYAIKFLVPSTQNVSRRISPARFNQRVRMQQRVMTNVYGGTTTTHGTGTYTGKRGGLVKERVAMVESFADRKTFQKERRTAFEAAGVMARAYGQESIGVETSTPRGRKLYFVGQKAGMRR